MPETTRYTVLKDGRIDTFRKRGDTIALTERQAKYLRMNGQIGTADDLAALVAREDAEAAAKQAADGAEADAGPETPAN